MALGGCYAARNRALTAQEVWNTSLQEEPAQAAAGPTAEDLLISRHAAERRMPAAAQRAPEKPRAGAS